MTSTSQANYPYRSTAEAWNANIPMPCDTFEKLVSKVSLFIGISWPILVWYKLASFNTLKETGISFGCLAISIKGMLAIQHYFMKKDANEPDPPNLWPIFLQVLPGFIFKFATYKVRDLAYRSCRVIEAEVRQRL